MERKLFPDLLVWKNSDTRKPLLLLGARQVGKTWLLKEFGRREYDNVVYINCDDEPLTKELFLADYDIDRLMIGFQAISGQSISRHSTLIVLDEIQEVPRALHSLKYFSEKAPDYHIVAAGSLLGVTLARQDSFPVGKVDMLHLYPMDFEEYLEAVGEEKLCDVLRMHDHVMEDAFSEKLADHLRRYYFVGGMPEVVKDFAAKGDLNRVRQLQTEIVEAYRKDVSKHTTKQEAVRIGQVMDSLPSQLAKENKRFIYGAARPGARAADFEMAIRWLIDAGIIYKIPRVNKIAPPLKFYEDLTAFKLFILDVGLLGCMAGVQATALLPDSHALVEFRGMLAEQYVAQQLISNSFAPFYWTNPRTPAEIDFVIESGDEAIPVEVKASINVRGKSISQFLKENPDARGIRLSLLGYRRQDGITNYPLYTVPFYFKHGQICDLLTRVSAARSERG